MQLYTEDVLVNAYKEYGAVSRIPSIWIYAKNDSFFGPELVARLLEDRWADVHPQLDEVGFIGRKTPCESSTRSYRATTAADGSFRIGDVPVGSYGFAVKPATQWIILIGSNCCTDLVAGGSYDVGAITLD